MSPDDYDALMLPGGAFNADALRVVPAAQTFASAFDRAQKPIAAICHAAWLLASADLLEGRKLTSYHTIHDDVENAGGDQPAARRHPQFNEWMIALFAGSGERAGAAH